MLHLNLNYKYFDQIKNGSKTHEYRPINHYWEARIHKLLPGDLIKFFRGYTSESVTAEIKQISYKHIDLIPTAARQALHLIYGGFGYYYFDIEFKLNHPECKNCPIYKDGNRSNEMCSHLDCYEDRVI